MSERYQDLDQTWHEDKPFLERISQSLWGSECTNELIVEPGAFTRTEVIQTPSGSLIRSKEEEVVYYRNSTPHVAMQGHKLVPRTSGVYWLAHSHSQARPPGDRFSGSTRTSRRQ